MFKTIIVILFISKDDNNDGATTKINQYIEEYEAGLEEMYMSGGKKSMRKHKKTYKKRKSHKLSRKNTRRHDK